MEISYFRYVKIKDVSCSEKSTFVLTHLGELYVFGGEYGTKPKEYDGFKDIKIDQIVSGKSYHLFLTSISF